MPTFTSVKESGDTCSGNYLDEFAWIPPGLQPHQVLLYFSGLPMDKVPYRNSGGERLRRQQLLLQLPPQDSDDRYCSFLTDEEKQELRVFSVHRKLTALGQATVRQLTDGQFSPSCEGCRKPMSRDAIAVFASRSGPRTCWHPACFVCCVCRELLVDLIYFYSAGLLYCGRHHAETLKPRCAACDEIIFAEECTEAEGKAWHVQHFSCISCERHLAGMMYITRDGRPQCLDCHETCSACGRPIDSCEERVSHGSRHWHATDSCFRCVACQTPLLDRPFSTSRGRVLCAGQCEQDTLEIPARASTPSLPRPDWLSDVEWVVHPHRTQTVEETATSPRSSGHQVYLSMPDITVNAKATEPAQSISQHTSCQAEPASSTESTSGDSFAFQNGSAGERLPRSQSYTIGEWHAPCSTCSSSSSDNNLYELPPRRTYGGVRLAYFAKDTQTAAAQRHRGLSSCFGIRLSRKEKYCAIS